MGLVRPDQVVGDHPVDLRPLRQITVRSIGTVSGLDQWDTGWARADTQPVVNDRAERIGAPGNTPADG